MTTTPPQATTAEAHTALVRRQHDAFNDGDLDGAASDFAEAARNHGQPVGRAGIRFVLSDIMATFPEGEGVAARCTFSGTHLGIARIPTTAVCSSASRRPASASLSSTSTCNASLAA